ncbi:TolC family protein [candidate division CSSED10-310 bacterium]|uniref:TolC family protein n=1 Tax=candidate division CSSED10-310 bacterium TaxID=2855610 RepID=A0ABV6Z1K8_UNCC1
MLSISRSCRLFLFMVMIIMSLDPVSLVSGEDGGGILIKLDEALIRAEAHHEQIQIDRERREQVLLLRKRAFASFLPVLTFNTTLTHYDTEIVFGDRTIQQQDALSGDVRATVPLYSAPLFPALSGARATAKAADLTFEWQKVSFLFEVSRTYFATLSAQNLVQTAERALLTAQEHHSATQTRLSAGEVLSLDVTRARMEVMTLERDLIKVRSACDGAFEYLSFLIQQDLPFRIESPVMAELEHSEGSQFVDRAHRDRPDLIAQEYTIEAGEYACREALVDYLPELNLTGTYRGTENTGFSGDNFSWNVLLSFDWMLYSGGKRGITRHERASQLQALRLQKRLLERRIKLEVQQAERDLKTARATLDTAEGKLALARENQELVLERFRAGLATSLEIIDADEQLRQAEYAVVAEQFHLELMRLEMFRVLGFKPLGKEIMQP